MATSEIQVQQLFSTKRLATDWDNPEFLAWFPFGIILLALRLLIALALWPFAMFCGLGRWVAALMGLRVTVVGKPDPSARILVANHITLQDAFPIQLVHPCLPIKCLRLPWPIVGLAEVRAPSTAQDLEYLLSAASSCSVPILVFPEETTTNGRVGLLHFTKWPFLSSHKIQPVAISVKVPLLSGVSLNCLYSTVLGDLLWMLFLPGVFYEIKFLPTIEVDQPGEEVSRTAQEILARELGLVTTNFNRNSKAALQPRPVPPRPAPPTTTPGSSTSYSNSKFLPVDPKSFAKKKEQLIADARRKYLAKRGLVHTD